MLWIVGGWGNRADPLRSCAERLQRSLRRMPSEPDRYGPWGVWQPREPDSESRFDRELISIDIQDVAVLEEAITTVTARGRRRTTPGFQIELSRNAIDENQDGAVALTYTARVGFVDKPVPFNRVSFDIGEGIDDRTLMAYMSALIEAWQPDHLGAVTQSTMREQGHKPPEAVVGRLTYVRDGTPLDTSMIGEDVDVAAADGGHYIRVPGTPADPSLMHIARVRAALGYPTPDA